MTELTSGKPPFYNRKHEISLVLEICNGIRPEFEKGTPEFYKKLAYRCMSAVPNQRPTANELYDILLFWHDASNADKEIPNISTSYEKIPDAIYTSRVFTFSNLPKPVNSSIITSYLEDEEDNKDCQF
ncbi:kinase-like domain-containing protein [Rhizophagus irregularis DAOM 181602=DAOM 197198]|nr:kinase-like domain-containing protein [Rhizophagus irregularis DAOM 181602=DAOM 197198]